MSVKPYFRPKDNYNIKPDELEIPVETPVKPDELEATVKPDELEVTTEPDKLGVPLSTLEAPQEPTKPAKPAVKRG